MNDHLSPVGKPAPPRPRRFDFLTSSTSAAGCSESALRKAWPPPRCWYTDSLWLSGTPKFFVTILTSLASSQLTAAPPATPRLGSRPGQGPDAEQRARGGAATGRAPGRVTVLPALAEIVDDRVELLLGEVEEVLIPADHHGRVRARGQALLLDDREGAVGRRLARLDAELPLEVVEQVVRAAQHARHVRAHHELVPPVLLAVEHRVEGDDAEDVRRRELERARHELEHLVGQVEIGRASCRERV